MKSVLIAGVSTVIIIFLGLNGFARDAPATTAAGGSGIIEKMFAAWNAHEPDAVAACFSEDGVYEDVAAHHISRGRAEVRGWAQGGLDMIGNFKLEVVSNSLDNGRGAAEWVWSGVDTGMFSTGKNFSVRGVSIYQVKKGRITIYKEFYDVATIMRQVGRIPAGND